MKRPAERPLHPPFERTADHKIHIDQNPVLIDTIGCSSKRLVPDDHGHVNIAFFPDQIIGQTSADNKGYYIRITADLGDKTVLCGYVARSQLCLLYIVHPSCTPPSSIKISFSDFPFMVESYYTAA
ncbi:hypothetical protein D3C73_996560 [compost metagenome]